MTENKQHNSYTVPNSDNVDLSWKRYILPAIHPEGLKIFGVAALIFIILGIFVPCTMSFTLPLLAFVFYFFRNPPRVTPEGDNLIISPADGIVSNIKYVVPPK